LSRGAKELIKDLNFQEVLIVSPVDGAFPLSKGVEVLSLQRFSDKLRTEMYQ
jgi:hypothetical protein